MKKLSEDFFSEEMQSDDEFDELCTQLLHIEPPPALVNGIMHSVTNLHSLNGTAEPKNVEKGLIIQHRCVQPS